MDTNDSLFERARQSIPGGVNSPVRAFGSVGRFSPIYEKSPGSLHVGRGRQTLH